jgi:lysozyme
VKTSPAGRALIESFEGLILQAYDDYNDRVVHVGDRVRGTLTIGYGHTDAAGPPHVYVGQEITREEANAILASDLTSVEIEVNHLVKVPLNQDQFDALSSFQLNTGWLGHPACSLLRCLNAGDYHQAAQDFLLYDRAGGRVLAGLVRRRQAEKALFEKQP